ncbi:MAG: translation initiation factor IF-3 [Acidimicrobiia bacterium]|nr:translation initiation factor IF-3 [Acidimicrobiia bacterium]
MTARRDTRVNERIRAREVRLVGPEGEQMGITPVPEALQFARSKGLDLVEVAAQANPPVCKVMDWGKHLYEESQRQKESRKKQAQVIVKEMKFRPKIDVHDYETKKKHVVRFLDDGAKVKITIMFRGREMTHTELGKRILDQLAEDLEEIASVEAQPKLDGRNMIMVLNPLKKDARAEAEVRPEERRKKTKGKGRRRREQVEGEMSDLPDGDEAEVEESPEEADGSDVEAGPDSEDADSEEVEAEEVEAVAERVESEAAAEEV